MITRIWKRAGGNGASRLVRGRKAVGVGAGLIAMLVSGASVAGGPAGAASELRTLTAAELALNESMDALARVVAQSMESEAFRKSIHRAAAVEFDGDTNALWSVLETDLAFRSALIKSSSKAELATSKRTAASIDAAAGSIPRLQVAVPVNFEDWNPESFAPLVAYMPAGIDDTDLETVPAYDSSGKRYELDAATEPDEPVVVLSQNERTDDEGNLLRPKQDWESGDEVIQGVAAAAAKATYQVRVVKIHLINDREPWASGKAEISMKAKSRGCSGVDYGESDWTGVDHNGDVWTGAREVGSTKCDVVFYWWEDDGTAFDFTLGVAGFSLGVKMDDKDDIIGHIQLAHSTFEGGSNKKSSWSDLEMWTD